MEFIVLLGLTVGNALAVALGIATLQDAVLATWSQSGFAITMFVVRRSG